MLLVGGDDGDELAVAVRYVTLVAAADVMVLAEQGSRLQSAAMQLLQLHQHHTRVRVYAARLYS